MLFFESKYYIPWVTPNKEQLSKRDPKYTTLLLNKLELRDRSRGGNNIAVLALDFYCVELSLSPYWKINIHKVLSELTFVEDLQHTSTTFEFTADAVGEYPYETSWTTYFDSVTECFISMFYDSTHAEYRHRIYVPLNVDRKHMTYSLTNRGYIERASIEQSPQIGILMQSNHGFSINYTTMVDVDIDLDLMYAGDFKSVSDTILDHVCDTEKTGLILLHGTPGTGKTSYIRWLSGQAKRKFVFIPPEVVSSMTSPAFADFLLRNTGLTFIVEDAEATLRPRMGSEGSIVTTILNLTDGLMGDILKCQFICTFNTRLEDVDSALLRPGRLLVRHEFGKLSISEVSELLDSRDIDIQVDEPKTLAEVLNIESMPTVTKQEPKRSFGFTSVA